MLKTVNIARKVVIYNTGLERERLLEVEKVLTQAQSGVRRRRQPFLYGRGLEQIQKQRAYATLPMETVKGVKVMGLETGMTLGKLDAGQAQEAKTGRFRLLQP